MGERCLRRPSSLFVLLLLLLSSLTLAYRPVQFVKHTGENGRADQAFSVTQYYNESTQQSDLYVRMEAFRYDSSSTGWTALAIGPQMKGALMFITYGDPSAPGSPMTFSVRSIDGHHPPRPLEEIDWYDGIVPEVDVSYAHFDEYTGEFYHEKMQKKPSHLGVAEFVVRGYDRWTGTTLEISNSTTNQAFIWSSNFKQDFEGDYSVERHIDMHLFGLGFGFLWVDLLNAQTPAPMYGPINDLKSHQGVNEIGDSIPPTPEELDAGDAYIASHSDGALDATPGIVTDIATATTVPFTPEATAGAEDPPAPTTSLNPNPEVEEPVQNHKQSSIRNWMWHLHGLFMVGAFMILYPLGVYFLRSGRGTSFNLHWTVQALGSVLITISAIIGFWQSHSISIAHQYLGILIVVAVKVQVILGWKHHTTFLKTKMPTWMSTVHLYLGRFILPLGMLNVFFGLKLREYGWLTIGLSLVVMVVELGALFVYVRHTKNRSGVRVGATGQDKGAPMTGAEAEEYFQLTADDDEFSDSDAEEQARSTKTKAQEEREKAERLRMLDKV